MSKFKNFDAKNATKIPKIKITMAINVRIKFEKWIGFFRNAAKTSAGSAI
ncbi:hypothetical protein MSIBF_A3470004 [groundwater metagenome]|uniref:Uncharacterized protein n=1 Tax=groundwater metagenome TaxID=717931 RepID=A0A098ECH8_9ZZZZ